MSCRFNEWRLFGKNSFVDLLAPRGIGVQRQAGLVLFQHLFASLGRQTRKQRLGALPLRRVTAGRHPFDDRRFDHLGRDTFRFDFVEQDRHAGGGRRHGAHGGRSNLRRLPREVLYKQSADVHGTHLGDHVNRGRADGRLGTAAEDLLHRRSDRGPFTMRERFKRGQTFSRGMVGLQRGDPRRVDPFADDRCRRRRELRKNVRHPLTPAAHACGEPRQVVPGRSPLKQY